MLEISEEDSNRLTRLWAETFLRLQEMGKLILKNQPTAKVFRENLGIKKMELLAVVKRKDGSIRKTQDYKFELGGNGKGKLVNRVIKNFPKGGKNG